MKFKEGDKVRLKKEYWKDPEFKSMERFMRKRISRMDGQVFFIELCRKNKIVQLRQGNDLPIVFQSYFLELVEPEQNDKPLSEGSHLEFRKGDEFKVVDEEGGNVAKIGDIVTLINNDGSHIPYLRSHRRERQIALRWVRLTPAKPEEKPKHRYTPEQESEAREIVYRLMCNNAWDNSASCRCNAIYFASIPNGTQYSGNEDKINQGRGRTVVRRFNTPTGRVDGTAIAFCQPTDAWSDDIGRLVALCKLLHEPLPAWVK